MIVLIVYVIMAFVTTVVVMLYEMRIHEYDDDWVTVYSVLGILWPATCMFSLFKGVTKVTEKIAEKIYDRFWGRKDEKQEE